MAHSPASRPDPPFESRTPEPGFTSQPDGTGEAAPDHLLHHYLNVLSASGGGYLSAEVALDLVLNEIAERACQATQASGAAIALTRDGEMVCRATTGENSPDIGARLSASHGLSGACLRTGESQCCNDTENDARVDAEACRRLAVRSILVVPVRHGEEQIGVFEIFSIQPHAFGDRDIEILENFSREISENVGSAENVSKPELRLVIDSPALPDGEPVVPVEKPEQEEGKPSGMDFSTTALLVCVIVLALILGWMVGRARWRQPRHRSVVPASLSVQSQPEASIPDSTTTAATSPAITENSTGRRSGSRAISEDNAEDDTLVITRNGKVIFRSPGPGSKETRVTALQSVEQPTSKRPRLRIPSEIAEEYLATRVDPEYPEQARRQRLQGPVVVDLWVGKDGAVRSVAAISGSPELLSAARQAVAQWRFHPFFHDGQPEEFVTRMTVEFRLP